MNKKLDFFKDDLKEAYKLISKEFENKVSDLRRYLNEFGIEFEYRIGNNVYRIDNDGVYFCSLVLEPKFFYISVPSYVTIENVPDLVEHMKFYIEFLDDYDSIMDLVYELANLRYKDILDKVGKILDKGKE